MPAPSGAVGLQLSRAGIRNPDLQRADLSIFCMLDQDEGIAVRGQDFIIPFRAGRAAGGRRAETRTLLLHCVVTDAAGPYQAAYNEFLSIFDTEAGPATLTVTLPTGEVRRLFEVYARTITAGQDGGIGMREFMVEIEALDPFYYGLWGNWTLDNGGVIDPGTDWWTDSIRTMPDLDRSADLVLVPNITTPFDTGGECDTERVDISFGGVSNDTNTAPVLSVSVVETGIGFSVAIGDEIAQVLLGPYTFSGRIRNYERHSYSNLVTLNAANQAGEFLRLPPKGTLAVTGATGYFSEVRLNFLPAFRGIGV